MTNEQILRKRIFKLVIELMKLVNEEGLVKEKVLNKIYRLYNNVRVWQLLEEGYSLKKARWEVDQRTQGSAEF